MFVGSMTFEELRNELDRDKNSFLAKTFDHSERVMKLMRKTRMTTYAKYFDYVSPRKNRWYYQLYAPSNKRKDFRVVNYIYFMTKRSYAVMIYLTSNDQAVYFTSHFFTRYFERMKHEHDAVHEIIRLFFSENNAIGIETIKDIGNDVSQVFVQHTTGVGLGYFHQRIKFVEMRTFISNDMLKGNQVELSKQLEEKFKLHVVREKSED